MQKHKLFQLKQLIYQIFVVIALLGIVFWFHQNVSNNMDQLGLETGFDFLFRNTHFDVTSGFWTIHHDDFNYQAIFSGVTNTLVVSLVGIILSTIIGLTIALMTMSHNWLMKNTAFIFVETFRNIPLIAQILFWYNCMIFTLPRIHQSINISNMIYINNRGVFIPQLEIDLAFYLIVLFGFAITYFCKKYLPKHATLFIQGLGCLSILSAYYFWSWSIPVKVGFNYINGIQIPPEFTALLIGLTCYTSSYTAEVIRSGLQSIPKGQYEAARSLGMSYSNTLKKIIIPQSISIIIPPLLNQYLNLTKNSSLGIAIGYPEIMAIFAGTVLNQTGNAIEIIAITMAIYLIISLSISAFLNHINQYYRVWKGR